MSAQGEYHFRLTCDHKARDATSGARYLDCAEAENYETENRFTALEKARGEGWMIQRSRQALCPAHAKEKRAGHWREKR